MLLCVLLGYSRPLIVVMRRLAGALACKAPRKARGLARQRSPSTPTLTKARLGCCSAGSVAWRLAARTLGEDAAPACVAAASLATAGSSVAAAARPASQLLRCAGLPHGPGCSTGTAFSSLAATVRPPKLPMSAAAAMVRGRTGLAAALHQAAPTPLAAAVRHQSSDAHLQRWEPSWASRPTAAAPDVPVTTAAASASGNTVQPAEQPESEVQASPQEQLERWLDSMYEQGFQVQLDRRQGTIKVHGQGGAMRLWVRQERFPHLEWILAGALAMLVAGGTQGEGLLAAGIYVGVWAVWPHLLFWGVVLGLSHLLKTYINLDF